MKLPSTAGHRCNPASATYGDWTHERPRAGNAHLVLRPRDDPPEPGKTIRADTVDESRTGRDVIAQLRKDRSAAAGSTLFNDSSESNDLARDPAGFESRNRRPRRVRRASAQNCRAVGVGASTVRRSVFDARFDFKHSGWLDRAAALCGRFPR